MTKKLDPNAFNFADWFGDVDRPEESADIFTRNSLVSEINRLQRQIEEDDRAAGVEEGSLGEESTPEEARLAELLEQFLASKRTVYMRGLTPVERQAIRKAHEASHEDDAGFALRCVAASVVAMRKPGGERTRTQMSLSMVKKMALQIGEGQMSNLFRTYQQATSGVPTVDADFLLRRSGRESTQE